MQCAYCGKEIQNPTTNNVSDNHDGVKDSFQHYCNDCWDMKKKKSGIPENKYGQPVFVLRGKRGQK